jgi:hypothetical protein
MKSCCLIFYSTINKSHNFFIYKINDYSFIYNFFIAVNVIKKHNIANFLQTPLKKLLKNRVPRERNNNKNKKHQKFKFNFQ